MAEQEGLTPERIPDAALTDPDVAAPVETRSVAGLDVALATDAGCVRSHNEDTAGVAALPEEQGVLLAVCDGMGGHAAGEVASRLACEALLTVADALTPGLPWSEWHEILLRAMADANAAVCGAAREDSRLRGMGSTAVIAAVTPSGVLHLHAGDSRLYLFRQGRRLYRTQDHSLVEALHLAGRITEEQMDTHPRRNVILSALGGHGEQGVEVSPAWEPSLPDEEQQALLPLQPGDTLLLCSDGLNSELGEQGILRIVSALAPQPAGTLARAFIAAARRAGGRDNITVAVVKREA